MSTVSAKSYRLQDGDVIIQHGDIPNYVIRFHDLPDEEKPREKLLKTGAINLSSAELVALVLNTGTVKEDVMEMSQRIIKEYGDKSLVNQSDPNVLAESLNIPLVKACQLIASFELGRRYFMRKAGKPVHIRNSKHAYDILKPMGDLRKEQLRGLYLNSRYQVIHDEVISIGSLTANIVHPREVFQPAIEYGAVAVVIAHNHPSNRLEPTLTDSEITKQLVAAAEILGIQLVDHLVITSSGYISLIS